MLKPRSKLMLLLFGAWLIGSPRTLAMPGMSGRSETEVSEATSLGPSGPHMTGFLRPLHSESIRPPSGMDWSFTINMLIPEGSRVAPGDLVARFDGERIKQELTRIESALLQAKVTGESKIAELSSQIDNLEKQISEERAALSLQQSTHRANTQIGAGDAIPARDLLVAALDIESRELKLKLSEQKLQRKKQLLATVRHTVDRNIKSTTAQVERLRQDSLNGERKAQTSGVVVYKRSSWERQKPRVGGTVVRGSEVLQIVDDRALYCEAYLREEDLAKTKVGDQVRVQILGRRPVSTLGRIKRISAIVMKAGDWDRQLPQNHPLFERRVFKLDIDLDKVPEEAKPDGEVEIQRLVEGQA